MFGAEPGMDADMFRAWHMVQELGEQLSHNHKLVASLKGQANNLKNQAVSNAPGYALRRYNVDLSQEVFGSELERSNAQTIIENQALLQENRQLSSLLRNYEETLETVMSKFRSHSLAAQRHEIILTRHYEALLTSREANATNANPSSNVHVADSIHRLHQRLRLLLSSLAGQDADSSPDAGNKTLEELGNFLESEESEDWAAEREREISRLERENIELRRFLGVDPESAKQVGLKDEELSEHRPVLHLLRIPPQTGLQDSVSSAWGVRSPPTQAVHAFGISAAPPVHGNAAPAGGSSVSSQSLNIPLQRTMELQQQMRTPAGTLRRPSMFGQSRGRGNGAFWSPSDRQWLQGNGAFDLGT